ncbi:MAG: PilZ domain-containing protein [Candidatus Omnitrophica bacterium]|nr:PilZ domain-containing protein [Candidatus Omnitrophota bacterium]
MSEQLSERRQFARIPVVFVATYKVREPVSLRMFIKSEETPATMVDLSEGGIAINTSCDIPVASILLIEFTFIDMTATADEPIHRMKIVGDVRYNVLKENGVHRLGIRFTEISESDKYIISMFCRKALAK